VDLAELLPHPTNIQNAEKRLALEEEFRTYVSLGS